MCHHHQVPTETESDDVRSRLVAATMAILASEGPSGVKARSVAARAGLTHSAVYNHFGGVPELLAAVVEEGYRLIAESYAAAGVGRGATSDPVSDCYLMALICRDVAQRNPHLYDLMFGLSARGTYRVGRSVVGDGDASSSAFGEMFVYLVEACERAIAQGRVRDDNPFIVAAKLWSFVHGFITLELNGRFRDAADPEAQILQPMGVDMLVGLGDERPLATRSGRSGARRFKRYAARR